MSKENIIVNFPLSNTKDLVSWFLVVHHHYLLFDTNLNKLAIYIKLRSVIYTLHFQ